MAIKSIYLTRHAQAEHNVAEDYSSQSELWSGFPARYGVISSGTADNPPSWIIQSPTLPSLNSGVSSRSS